MKVLRFIGLFLLVMIATILNIIELIFIVLSYALYGLGYILIRVFKPVAEWLLDLLKKFNFLGIFRRYEK